MHDGTICEIDVDEIPDGFILSQPVQDEDGNVLLAENKEITAEHRRELRDRGIEKVALHQEDHERVLLTSTSASSEPSDAHKYPKSSELKKCYEPLRRLLPNRWGEDICPEREKRLQNIVHESAASLLVLSKKLQTGPLQDSLPLRQVSDTLTDILLEDVDQAIGFLLRPTAEVDLATRIAHLAALSMAISIELDMPATSTMEVGLTAILHDLSLFTLSPRLRSPATVLTPEEQVEYQNHPLQSARMIKGLDVPEAVRQSVAQVHEQLDGSGYPRNLSESKIHPYAKIINVAETYLRIIGPGPNRPPVVQHDAIGVILHPQDRRLFDPYVVRSFVNVITLFPLGSRVVLSNGSKAQVIRRPKNGFSLPTVKISTDDGEEGDGEIVTLENSDLKIVRPFCDVSIGQQRIPHQAMMTNPWHPSDY